MDSIAIVVGGGASARHFLPVREAVGLEGKTFCSDNGYTWLPDPDYYVIPTLSAAEKHIEAAVHFSRLPGTRILAPKSTVEFLSSKFFNGDVMRWFGPSPKLPDALEFDELNANAYARGKLAHGKSSEVLTLQIALDMGFDNLHLFGFDAFDEGPGSQGANDCATYVLGQILADRTDCKFTLYGADDLFFPEWKYDHIMVL